MTNKVKTYSDIEFSFFDVDKTIEAYLNGCQLLLKNGNIIIDANTGEFYDDSYLERHWVDYEQVYNDIIGSNVSTACINLESSTLFNGNVRFSFIYDLQNKCIWLSIGEEYFIDNWKSIDLIKLNKVVSLFEDLAKITNPKLWYISQTGFDRDEDAISKLNLETYNSDNKYPQQRIDNLVTWYEDTYFKRWG